MGDCMRAKGEGSARLVFSRVGSLVETPYFGTHAPQVIPDAQVIPPDSTVRLPGNG